MKCGEFLWRPEASGLIPIICSLLSSSPFSASVSPSLCHKFLRTEAVVPHVRNPHDGAESVPSIAVAVIISSHLGKVKFKTGSFGAFSSKRDVLFVSLGDLSPLCNS